MDSESCKVAVTLVTWIVTKYLQLFCKKKESKFTSKGARFERIRPRSCEIVTLVT